MNTSVLKFIAYAVFPIAFNAIFFLGDVGSLGPTGWIAYAFIMADYALACVMPYAIRPDRRWTPLAMTVSIVGHTFFAFMLIVNICFFVLDFENKSPCLTTNIIMTAAFVLTQILLILSNDKVLDKRLRKIERE